MIGSAAIIRWIIGWTAVFVLSFSVLLAWDSAQVKRIRLQVIAFVSDYEGCLCGDCTMGHLGVAYTPYCGCCPAGLFDGQLGVASATGGPAAAAIVIVGPLWGSLSRLRRRRIRNPHLCAQCGYPRAGIAFDAPCPECGRLPGHIR